MDLEAAKFVFNVLQFLLTGGIGIYVYISNKQRVTRDRVEAVASEINNKLGKMETETDLRLDDHTERIAGIEATIRHQPTTKDIEAVRDLVARVGGDVRALEGKINGVVGLIDPMQKTLQLVNEYLLNKKS